MRSTTTLGAVVVVLALASPIMAVEIDRETAAALARAATTDAGARAELAAVDHIEGAPVDLEAALDGATETERTARLETLARLVAVPPADDAPGQAREILDQLRYSLAQPSWWDRFWRRTVTRLLRLLDGLASIPGGPLLVGGIGLAAVVGLAAAVTARLARRRARRIATETSLRRAFDAGIDSDELEASARRAASDGDWSEAVRLRFLAGLARADRQGLIRFAPGLTTHEVSEALRSPAFDRLAAQFDEIVYGGREAGPDDDAAARRDWAEVLGVRVR